MFTVNILRSAKLKASDIVRSERVKESQCMTWKDESKSSGSKNVKDLIPIYSKEARKQKTKSP
jgi:hypothetical protein